MYVCFSIIQMRGGFVFFAFFEIISSIHCFLIFISSLDQSIHVTPQLPKQIVQYHMSKEISPSGGNGTKLGGLGHEDDQQVVDVDLCPSNQFPHLLGEESVDMAEVSAYVSPCSSADESDNSSSEQSSACREDQELLMAHLENGLMEMEVSRN